VACVYAGYSWGIGQWLFATTFTQAIERLRLFLSSSPTATHPPSTPSFHSPELPIELNHIPRPPTSSTTYELDDMPAIPELVHMENRVVMENYELDEYLVGNMQNSGRVMDWEAV
jgi:hypothetical protein